MMPVLTETSRGSLGLVVMLSTETSSSCDCSSESVVVVEPLLEGFKRLRMLFIEKRLCFSWGVLSPAKEEERIEMVIVLSSFFDGRRINVLDGLMTLMAKIRFSISVLSNGATA